MITVYLVEDDKDFCLLIQRTIEKAEDMEFLGCTNHPETALEQVEELKPDVVLVDLCLDGESLEGIETARKIRLSSDAKVLILTGYEDMNTVSEACFRSFASEYIFKKDFLYLTDRIRASATGITSSEILIFSLIVNRLTPSEKSQLYKILGKDIQLMSSPKTQANQKSQLLKRLGLSDSREIIHLFKNIPIS
ncbi:response regulator [Blautia sp. An249]|uniref:response regulator n=1 Tax=Blautia sp. An249 TaxID=1965603 RepID=UPI0013A608F4|nr:response regulator [Blautia sp. An249]